MKKATPPEPPGLSNVQSIRLKAFNAAMGIADGTLTIAEVVQRAIDIGKVGDHHYSLYFLLNVAAFLPDYYELQIRNEIKSRLLNEKA